MAMAKSLRDEWRERDSAFSTATELKGSSRRYWLALGVLLSLPLLAVLIVWYRNGPGSPYDVKRLQSEIRQKLPVGSGRSQVVSWLKEKDFAVILEPHEVAGQKYPARKLGPCNTSVLVDFTFDTSGRLAKSRVSQTSTCL